MRVDAGAERLLQYLKTTALEAGHDQASEHPSEAAASLELIRVVIDKVAGKLLLSRAVFPRGNR